MKVNNYDIEDQVIIIQKTLNEYNEYLGVQNIKRIRMY